MRYEKPNGKPLRVLIIEDNPAFRASLRALVASHSEKIEIRESADGNDVVALVAELAPDILFVDVHLPGKTGLSITRAIKRRFPDMPIAILTNYDLPEYRSAAQHSGANYFFGKDTVTADDIRGLLDRYAACASRHS